VVGQGARWGATTLLRAGAGAACAVELRREDVAAELHAELGRWLAADPAAGPSSGGADPPLDPLALAQWVTAEVRWVGRHHLDGAVLRALAAIADRHRGLDPALDAFLHTVLDKHERRFWNRTYLALPLLEQLTFDPAAGLPERELIALLAADVVRNELCAAHRGREVGDTGRPDGRTLRTRVRHAMRIMAVHLDAPATAELLAAEVHEPEAALPEILSHLPVPPSPRASEWLALTVLPTSTVHDEHAFIRGLQCHELGFDVAARLIAAATSALRDGRVRDAASFVGDAATEVVRGGSLFRMVATTRPAAFHAFRVFTDGASAIQSESYKRFELRCCPPPERRLRSPAFDSVPSVRDEADAGGDSLAAAYRDALAGSPDHPALPVLAARLRDLEDGHRRWRATHLSLAERFLGDAPGTGYTAGVPYLRAWVEHPLLWDLPPGGLALSPAGVCATLPA
jgi:tryptophan 2,3-dioxygenase